MDLLDGLRGARVLLGVSSSIAAHRALDLASLLRKQGAEVRAVLTANVPNLIGAAAFDAITHQRTITSLWDSPTAGEMDHLAVTKWAEVFVVCPCTANTLAVLAHGIASDALGTFAIAWNKSSLLIAPAMNPEMWRNAAVRANVETLRERGHVFVGPVEGRTACDDDGAGRLAPVESIASAVAEQLRGRAGKGPLAGRTILITSGPTREFADHVRCITNPSTGRQGIALAREATRQGANVILVLGPTSVVVPGEIGHTIRVTSAEEMLAAVLENLPTADATIFAAAVSDWRPVDFLSGKAKKEDGEREMTLRLERTPDIAATANQRRRPGQVFVGFAAESENLEGYAGEKMRRKGFAIVFANPINEAGAGFASETNRGLLLRDDGSRREVASASKDEIAHIILGELTARLQ